VDTIEISYPTSQWCLRNAGKHPGGERWFGGKKEQGICNIFQWDYKGLREFFSEVTGAQVIIWFKCPVVSLLLKPFLDQ
jgi:hypothetical protein